MTYFVRSCSRNQKMKWMAVFLVVLGLALTFVLASFDFAFAVTALPGQVQMVEADENGNFGAVFKVPIPNGVQLNEYKSNVAGLLQVVGGATETTVTMNGNLVDKTKGGEWQVTILDKVPDPTIYQVVRLLIAPKGSLTRMTKNVGADAKGNFPSVSFVINKPQVDAKIMDTTKDNVVGLFGPGLVPANGGTKTEVVVGPGKLADPKKPGKVVVYVDPPGTYFELTLNISPAVGGIVVSVDKFGLLAPYIGVASTILVATVATAIYAKRVKRRKEKQ